MISDEKAMKILVRRRARTHQFIRPTERRVSRGARAPEQVKA
jgi:hypothetical protein